MKVMVAETAGFCRGVKKAMEVTLEAVQARQGNEQICTFGPLIHNRQVLAILEQKGVKATESVAECSGKKVIVRAHGIPPEQRQALHAAGATIVNATCQRVAKVQAVIKSHARHGYHIVIVGDAEHAEVVGLMGYTAGRGTVLSRPEEVEGLPPTWDKVLLVAQTTQNEAVFAAIQERFAKRYPQGVIKNTICGSTHERQAEVRALAARVDAMVIVGGFHSGNTVRLAEIARECGVPTFHIETEADLHPEDMGKYAVVGVSAGASTPNWMIRNVVRFLETLEARQRPREIGQLVARAWDFLVKTNVHVALGAGLLTFAAQAITGWQGLPGSSAMAGLYVFAMHTFNRYLDRDAIQFNDPERAAFDRRWQRVFLLLSIGAAAAALGVGAANGAAAFLAMLVLIVFGLLYGVRIFGQGRLPPFSILKLKDIPASKTLLVPIAWACATVLIPQLPHLWSAPGRLFFATGMIFLVMFVRTALFDLQDVQGDRLVGRETIAVFVGEENTRRIVFAGLGLLAVQVLAGATVGLSTSFAHALPPFVAVYAWCVHRCLRNPLKRKNGFANAVEALPAILGLLGLLWGWLAA